MSSLTIVAANNPFRFDSGYETSSGLYHFGARYDDPSTNRWTQLDPSGSNTGYAFAANDPVIYTDPTGDNIFSPVAKAICAATIFISTSFGALYCELPDPTQPSQMEISDSREILDSEGESGELGALEQLDSSFQGYANNVEESVEEAGEDIGSAAEELADDASEDLDSIFP